MSANISGRKPVVYLLLGPEQVLRDRYIQQIRSKHFSQSDDIQMNSQSFNAAESTVADITGFAATAPFLAPYRMLLIDSAESFSAEAKRQIISFFDATSGSHGIWVFMTSEVKLRNVFLKQISDYGHSFQCGTGYGLGDAKQYIREWFGSKNRKIHPMAVEQLTALKGSSLTDIDSACEQLDLMTAGKAGVDIQDVKLLIGESKEQNVFSIYESLKYRRMKEAVSILNQMKSDGVRSHQILSSLIQQFDRILRIKSLMERGMSQPEMAGELKWHPYAVKMAAQLAGRLQTKTLLQDLSHLKDADFNLKKGLLREDLALDQCLCRLGNIEALS